MSPELNLEAEEQSGQLEPGCTYFYEIPPNNGTDIDATFSSGVRIGLIQANVTLLNETSDSFFRQVPGLDSLSEIQVTLHNPGNSTIKVQWLSITSAPTGDLDEEFTEDADDRNLVVGIISLVAAFTALALIIGLSISVGWKAWKSRWSRLQEPPETRL